MPFDDRRVSRNALDSITKDSDRGMMRQVLQKGDCILVRTPDAANEGNVQIPRQVPEHVRHTLIEAEPEILGLDPGLPDPRDEIRKRRQDEVVVFEKTLRRQGRRNLPDHELDERLYSLQEGPGKKRQIVAIENIRLQRFDLR